MRTMITFLRRVTPLIAAAALFLTLWEPTGTAQAERRDMSYPPAQKPLPLKFPVQDKNFYLLSLLQNDLPAKKSLMSSKVLRQLFDKKRNTLTQIFEKRQTEGLPGITELGFTEEEISAASKELARLYQTDGDIRRLVDGPLRASGMYQKYSADPGERLLTQAWRDCALGLNNILSVYGLGNTGRSPDIDSMSYDPKSFDSNNWIHNYIGLLLEDTSTEVFFQPELKFALTLLDTNRRDEAGRFEPMEKGENRAAFRRVASIAWDKYPYSVILVPGEGPEEHDVRLTPGGKLRLTIAVKRFRAGKAPFLLVSGGYVHPKQTPYCEADEMKKSLIKDFGIPENAIIIDPHARHTTTNLRNAARLIYRYGLPFDKVGLISTDTDQSGYIENKEFQARCQKIFGYQPCLLLRRLSPFDLEFRPKIESLYADPIDPLDP